MFHRFTQRARQVVVVAQEEARLAGHSQIFTEHILLGLLREEESVAARALASLEITVERVRAQVIRAVGSGEASASDELPLAPDATNALDLALREAGALGHNYVGPEHILLGLVRETDAPAARILRAVGADAEAVRNAVIRALAAPVVRRRQEADCSRRRPRATADVKLPELGTLSDHELRDLIRERSEREREVSYERRILHGEIDVLRFELVTRLRRRHEAGS